MAENKNPILVTGCSGRIGKKVIEALKGNYSVIGLDVIAPFESTYDWSFIPMDITSEKSVKEAFNIVREHFGSLITSLIHLAGYSSFSASHPEKYDKVNVQGTRRLLEAVKQFETEQFIFTSTQLVYAPCKLGQKISEKSPLKPKWEHPQSKLKAEKLIHEIHGAIPTVILQPAGCYDEKCQSIPLSQQIQRIYENQLTGHFFPGDKRHGIPYLHFADLVEAILLAIQKRRELPSETKILLGETETPSYDAIQHVIGQSLNEEPWETYYIPPFLAKFGASLQNSFIQPWMIDIANDHYQLDITKAKNILGWAPSHTLLETLPSMISFLKRDPAAFYKINGLTMPKWLKTKLS